jgi:hypothetical protein
MVVGADRRVERTRKCATRGEGAAELDLRPHKGKL